MIITVKLKLFFYNIIKMIIIIIIIIINHLNFNKQLALHQELSIYFSTYLTYIYI